MAHAAIVAKATKLTAILATQVAVQAAGLPKRHANFPVVESPTLVAAARMQHAAYPMIAAKT